MTRGEASHSNPARQPSKSHSPTSGDAARFVSHQSTVISSADRFEVSNSPDNIHSPYYLHNSDHPDLVLVSEPLDGNNYGIWLIAMTTSLEAKNKLGFLDGSIAKPLENDQYFKIWCRCNRMLKSWLLNSVSKKIYTSILYIKHAADIRKDLHTRFHKSNLPRLYKLRQIHSLRQGSLDLSSYHIQTQALWEELISIQPPASTVEEFLAEKETNCVIDFLMGLNESYASIRSRILMKKTPPSLSEVFNLLDHEDSQRDASVLNSPDLSTTSFHVSQSSGHGALTQSQSSSSSSSGPSGGYIRKDRPYCTHCHRVGHVVDKCYKKHGYPNSFKPNQRNDKISIPVTANVTVEKAGIEILS
ncbi:PREDICTED: uncharacterized protein LOC106344636 [Brassica oleracea var. oleracea]|uniref:uncharacterized protein LOC106344636 n=1 Tax=Brassica oleracea var. oleracea TaxID=109376 RepID=UPI0006A6F7A9|nr:PREDICTED: uncharacterized protein LOC106344636 [Brassica oleracea var. oleracea]